MFFKELTRRKFVKYGFLSLTFFLNSCSNISKTVKVALQSSFYPDFFKENLPKVWHQKNINFEEANATKNKKLEIDSEYTLINDGWITSLDIKEFNKINKFLPIEKLDLRSRDFLSNFDESYRERLFPIGVVPYAVIIKNNKGLINSARKSWDFLLSEQLKNKIILPQSPRLIMSIARKINVDNPLVKLKSQAMLFDDKDSLNWLINSDASVSIIPYTFCLKYLKIDTRLSIVFPNVGVPLMWHFILGRSNNNEQLIEWINSFENKLIADRLAKQGWYLPFNSSYIQSKYSNQNSAFSGPSQRCWENSWSFPYLTNLQKINLENAWNESLIP
tara:strand:+ start:5146 stop:6141 length:996 start_codon:yes stop_codon:yes gene_type:complete